MSSAGSAGEQTDGPSCAAHRGDAEGNRFETDAFSGIGGAGAMLAGTCQRCGWDARGDACQALVYTVPTIDDPNYSACIDLSIEFARCLEQESCICGGSIPDRCGTARGRLDECLEAGTSMTLPDPIGGSAPADWVAIETSCGFSLSAPPNYREAPVQGVDSCVLQFTAGDCDYSADYGAFSGDLGSEPECGRTSEPIDGLVAELMVCPQPEQPGHFVTGVHFATTGTSSARLTMLASCRTGNGAMDSHTLFRTIRFNE